MKVAVIGGGAAGFFSAIHVKVNYPNSNVTLFDKSKKLLAKVKISGGGRCNVTNASWVPHELIDNYPRGGKKLLESLSRFATGDVFAWFEEHGLKLKIENDLRVFPVSDSSIDVVNCVFLGRVIKVGLFVDDIVIVKVNFANEEAYDLGT